MREVVATLLLAVCLGLPQGLEAQRTLRVAAYNIKHGEGMDGEVELSRAAEVLRALDADVITLQEMDRGVARTDGVDQAAVLGEMLGMEAFFGDFMPYQGGHYGMAVLSRLPVLEWMNHRLPDGDEPRTALEVVVDVPGVGPVSVVGIHFYRTEAERLAQAQALDTALAEVDHPALLVGDFNSQRGDGVMDYLGTGWRVLAKDGQAFTFPSDTPEREIDFVLMRPADAFDVVEHRVVDERVASDHRPLLVVLGIR